MKVMFFVLLAGLAFAANAELRINAICPRPGVVDENGHESGWVELINLGEEPVNLADYELVRKNRGKKMEAGKMAKNLLSETVAPGATVKVLTSEDYPNCEDLGGSGKVARFGALQVYPAKVNPKKFPYIALYGKGSGVAVELDAVAVPVDIVDGAVFRRDFTNETRYKWDIVSSGEIVPYGPNVGPLYGVKHDRSDLEPTVKAVAGHDYAVRLPVNPVSKMAGDAIRQVVLEFSADFGESQQVAMTQAGSDKSLGALWSASIPANKLPAPGKLLRWRARITDGDGNEWVSPSFKNPDDGYEWYGTIVDELSLEDAKLPTWHMFVTGNSLSQMDKDTDKQDRTKVPYNARAAIYDSQTGRYYDNVRIDLRGNTSGGYRKKSHGFRFAKCNAYKGINPVDGSSVEIRKTSLTAEYGDPIYIRQMLAFHVFAESENYVPFMYPVRVNLNGEFYQLAFHSARFSDELIEDQYGLDPNGYGYKNSGCLTPTLKNWVVCEKKTPDDGDETSANAYAPLKAWTTAFGSSMVANQDDQTAVTREVVKSFNLPAWINYLAEARITSECDDSWANLSTYWDQNGNGTWMPLGYDMNQSWGYIYRSQWNNNWRNGLIADEDRHKSHPFFGGRRVLCYFENGGRSHAGSENWAFEAVWQSTKFRRMYLRRLRTLMDSQLCAPGTPKEQTPVWKYVEKVIALIEPAAALDHAKWRYDDNWWKSTTSPYGRALTLQEGVDDLWNSYIVPRRTHLYVTHSATNTAVAIGYGEGLNAGIPEAQPSTMSLKNKIRLANTNFGEFDPSKGVLVITNGNSIAVDVSGWKLSGGVEWTLPAGAVIDAEDCLYVVKDRIAYVSTRDTALTDEVIVGNATFVDSKNWVRLADGDGTAVFYSAAPSNPAEWFDSNREGDGEWSESQFELLGEATNGEIYAPAREQPSEGKTAIDFWVYIQSGLPAGELPSASGYLAGLTIAGDFWYGLGRTGWVKFESGVPVLQETDAVVRVLVEGEDVTYFINGKELGKVKASAGIANISKLALVGGVKASSILGSALEDAPYVSGEEKFGTLDAAVAAAKTSGQLVVLLDDGRLDFPRSGVTIELNGKKLTLPENLHQWKLKDNGDGTVTLICDAFIMRIR